MSEPSGTPQTPQKEGGMGGPISRPSGEGIPPKTGGGMRPGYVAGGDSRDPGMEGGADRGADAGGMIGEG